MLVEDNGQKTKISWLTMEDDCIKKIHAKISTRRHINSMDELLNEDINSHGGLCAQAVCIYKELYNGDLMCSEFPVVTCKKIVNSSGLNEIKTTIFSTQDNKAPGTDGYNAKFYKLH